MMPHPALFAPLLAASLAFFCWSVYRRFSLVLLGQPEQRLDRPLDRLKEMLLYAFGQLRVLKKPFGLNHFVIFWSFMILALANGEFLLNGVFPAVRLELLPEGVHHLLLLAFDLVSLLTLVAIALSFGRRLLVKPPPPCRSPGWLPAFSRPTPPISGFWRYLFGGCTPPCCSPSSVFCRTASICTS